MSKIGNAFSKINRRRSSRATKRWRAAELAAREKHSKEKKRLSRGHHHIFHDKGDL